MFKDKELRKVLYGVHYTQDKPVGSGKYTNYNFEDGTTEKVEQTDGLVFHLLKELRALKDKIAALEMSRANTGVCGSVNCGTEKTAKKARK